MHSGSRTQFVKGICSYVLLFIIYSPKAGLKKEKWLDAEYKNKLLVSGARVRGLSLIVAIDIEIRQL